MEQSEQSDTSTILTNSRRRLRTDKVFIAKLVKLIEPITDPIRAMLIAGVMTLDSKFEL